MYLNKKFPQIKPAKDKKEKQRNQGPLEKLKIETFFRVASGPGISGNLEKSGNFLAFEKGQGIS